MEDWIQRQEEEAYLEQLEQIVVQRLQIEAQDSDDWSPTPKDFSNLDRLSLEMNLELDRLEKMIAEEFNRSVSSLYANASST